LKTLLQPTVLAWLDLAFWGSLALTSLPIRSLAGGPIVRWFHSQASFFSLLPLPLLLLFGIDLYMWMEHMYDASSTGLTSTSTEAAEPTAAGGSWTARATRAAFGFSCCLRTDIFTSGYTLSILLPVYLYLLRSSIDHRSTLHWLPSTLEISIYTCPSSCLDIDLATQPMTKSLAERLD